jgi:hypothetical protein
MPGQRHRPAVLVAVGIVTGLGTNTYRPREEGTIVLAVAAAGALRTGLWSQAQIVAVGIRTGLGWNTHRPREEGTIVLAVAVAGALRTCCDVARHLRE